ncbi:NAD(P)/FAD-dependent oxidoreductase [Halomonas sp. HNIBRBA4712]|uniref:NAD(P)/FAD-dependent oxidoreductase n=1 Tax=Halomonas sp. HNIBRBA4712 TaxID=3373087 RepID=UPI003744C3F2
MRPFSQKSTRESTRASTQESTRHLVIVGNGMACHRLVEALVKSPARPARITVIGQEPVPAYNRILLSPLLAGETDRAALTLREAHWYAEHGITLRLGERVLSIDPDKQRVVTERAQLGFDALVLATGSTPAWPEVPGIALEGVNGFRDLQDAETLGEIARRGGQAVVIGGGLLGLEAAEGLRKRSGGALAVSVLQRSERLMNRQLDAHAGALLKTTLETRGLAIHTGARLDRIIDDGQGKVAGVALEDGRVLEAQSVIVAAGITPNDDLARRAGLACDRAICVDHHLRTSHPAIYALGECCQFEEHTFGLVEPIWRQVEVLARVLCGESGAGYVEAPSATKLKISGIDLYAFGPVEAAIDHEVLCYSDPESGEYRRLLLKDGRIEGAVLYGDTAQGPWYFAKAQQGADLSAARPALLFGQADVETLLHTPTQEAA